MRWLEHFWYRISPLHLVLWPLSLAFAALAALRRLLYRHGVLATTRLPVPLIVVGNISVGGTGKTPLVIWLAGFLREQGLVPGIVSRGYGGKAAVPQRADADSDPRLVGDEAVLLARRSGCPVWVGAQRAAAARSLLAAHPACNVIVCDDGLQHYALARDVEVAVIDGVRGFGNGMLLPAGPLREPRRRLDETSAVVINGAAAFSHDVLPHGVPLFEMNLGGDSFYDLHDPQRRASAGNFTGQSVHAVAAIGNPGRFFAHLRELGVTFAAHPFPDHHAFAAGDIAFGDGAAVLMTEKDAVKCERLAPRNCWALPVEADVDTALGALILRKIGK